MSQPIIEQATLHDMQYLLNAAKAEGWNPSLSDAAPFYYTDPNGFFIEKLNNKPIGCISAVAYNDSYGFMGFYIVMPELRHQGYGMKLWERAMSYLGNRVIGCDGVVAQQENYKKSGFVLYYNNIRFEGKLKGMASQGVQPIDTIPFQDLLDYDTAIYGIQRPTFLQHWITMPQSYGAAKTSGKKVVGYGVIRKCETGYKIGPLFADNPQIAEEIFLSLAAKANEKNLFLDVAQSNSDALKLAQKYNLSKVFETARMYKGTPPKQVLKQVFGVTTFELG